MPKQEVDIVTISHHHPDHDDLTRVKNEAFVIDAPGEYEIKGVGVWGLASFHNKEKSQKNNIFLVNIEGVRVCHLGDLGVSLSQKQLDQFNGVDVLLVKPGHEGFLSIKETIDLINQIEPAVIVPMHFKTKEMDHQRWKSLVTLDEFLKAYEKEPEKVDKLVLKKGSLSEEETRVVVMERRK